MAIPGCGGGAGAAYFAYPSPKPVSGLRIQSQHVPSTITSPHSEPKVVIQPFEPEMVVIPGGSFLMGSPADEKDRFGNERQHLVSVKDFEMARTPVTQGQWKAVMESNPSYFKDCGDECPVESVSWYDVQEFIKKINVLTNGDYRLPTEVEWEYAGRGGRVGERYCGGDDLDTVAWHRGNSSRGCGLQIM